MFTLELGLRVLAILILLLLTFEAGRRGVADVNFEYGESQFARWLETESEADYTRAIDGYRSAVAWVSQDPRHQLAMGRTLENRWLAIEDLSVDEQVADLEMARVHYLNAMEYGPLSAEARARLAWLKAKLGEVDGQFKELMNEANRLGPHEPGIQVIVVEAGLTAWHLLDNELRELVRKTMVLGLESISPYQRSQMTRTIKRHKGMMKVCPYLKRSEANLRLCKTG